MDNRITSAALAVLVLPVDSVSTSYLVKLTGAAARGCGCSLDKVGKGGLQANRMHVPSTACLQRIATAGFNKPVVEQGTALQQPNLHLEPKSRR